MVFPATDAVYLTSNTITTTSSTDLQVEVSLVEERIREAAGLGVFSITYDAQIIGNPGIDPRSSIDLPQLQLDFYNLFSAAGYLVGLDRFTGRWFFSWASTGAEQLVAIYSIRTSMDPAAVVGNTLDAIAAYFASISPVVHSRSSYNSNINEVGFGATSSVFYEFTVIVDQESDTTNHAGGLKSFLINSGFGYNFSNMDVIQLVI